MKKRHYHKRNDSGVFLRWTLDDTLPAGQAFELNTRLGTFSLLGIKDGRATTLWQEILNTSEQSLLRALLKDFSHYCPYETAYAFFYSDPNKVEDKTIERARRRLNEAAESGTWDYEMRPIRNDVSRLRLKLEGSGIEVKAILHTGYKVEYRPVLEFPQS